MFQQVDNAKTAEDRLAAAVAAAKWLNDRGVSRFYYDRFKQWLALAEVGDPENKQGDYEAVFVGYCLGKLHEAKTDIIGKHNVTDVVGDLNRWKEKCTFHDTNRAFDLYMRVAAELAEKRGPELPSLLQAALEIEPGDPELKRRRDQLSAFAKYMDVAVAGSGFFIAEGGFLLTNQHVIEGRGGISVEVAGKRIPAELVAQDAKRDLALLHVALGNDSPTPLRFAAGNPETGAEVIAFGFPSSDEDMPVGEFRQQPGSITGERVVAGIKMLSVDCRINPGISGGPLCNIKGEVVGVVRMKTAASRLFSSERMVLSPEIIREFLDECLPSVRGLNRPSPAESQSEKRKEDLIAEVKPSVVLVLKLRP